VNHKNQDLAAIEWARVTLGEFGYELNSIEPVIVKNTPWSYVAQFQTSEGHIYLKQVPEAIAVESKIIEILQQNFGADVPEIISENASLHCFLMKDAGRPLRERLKEKFDNHLLCEAAQKFTELQMIVAKKLKIFFEVGVPDWRLDKLPKLYHEVIQDEDLLLSEGFSLQQIESMKCYEEEIKKWCEALAMYPIPESIIQPDFHDNNLLIDDTSNKITWIDLGEVLISHPFFPLFTYLMQIKKHHALEEGDVVYEKIKNTCFQPYRQLLETNAHFEHAIRIAEKLNIVYGVAYQYRFMQICEKELLIAANQWYFKSTINELMRYM